MSGTGRSPAASNQAMTTQTITTTDAVRLLTPGEVARLFSVDPKTVTKWANTGRLTCIRTIGNQRRYREDAILAILNGAADVG
jgi:excisionase family DNA binding protein